MGKSVGGVRGGGSTSTSIFASKTSYVTVQQFADSVLAYGMSRGKELKIGTLNEYAQRELENQKINLVSKDVLITDDVIMKYTDHPKRAKGATLPANKYGRLKNIVNNPKHIYIDTKQKDLVLVFADKGSNGKVVKAIIQPNFKKGKRVFNKVKSIGVVDARHMKQSQYKKIK